MEMVGLVVALYLPSLFVSKAGFNLFAVWTAQEKLLP
jgi:hypothetical protein